MNMYDTLRPLVIHMKHFETLVELCTILRIEILQDYVYEDGKKKLNTYYKSSIFAIV